jgi:hypothetical protein
MITKTLAGQVFLQSAAIFVFFLSNLGMRVTASASAKPSKELINAIIGLYKTEDPKLDQERWSITKPPFSFLEIDLNQDGIKETIVLYRLRKCYNRGCYVDIFKTTANSNLKCNIPYWCGKAARQSEWI